MCLPDFSLALKRENMVRERCYEGACCPSNGHRGGREETAPVRRGPRGSGRSAQSVGRIVVVIVLVLAAQVVIAVLLGKRLVVLGHVPDVSLD